MPAIPSRVPQAGDRSKDPEAVLRETEQQWIYPEIALDSTPSIADGMLPDQERLLRSKGVNFIIQVGVMLKLPQTTISTASVFFNRFLMRYSLVNKPGAKALHHYQIAAVALFLATKVEEHPRKLKEIVVSCCRVAQKNPVLLVDEQTKDFWRWKDTITHNEDVMLELLCFDLTLDSPYKILYDLIKVYGVAHNKLLRDTAWSFLNDSGMTQLCLLYPSRTIACAALYCAAKRAEVAFKDDKLGRPWWEGQRVKGYDLRSAYNHMASFFANSPLRPGQENIYVGGLTPPDGDENHAKTRLRREQAPTSPDAAAASDSDSSRKRPIDAVVIENGNTHVLSSRVPAAAGDPRPIKRQRADESEETARNGTANFSEGSEDGELEE